MKGVDDMRGIMGLIKKYKIFYSGWFSPVVLPFWSMIVIYIFCATGSLILRHEGFKAFSDYDEWWGEMGMIVVVSLSSAVGFVRFLMVIFELAIPVFQRSAVAVIASIVYVPLLVFLLFNFYLAFGISLMFVWGMIFGVK